MWEFLKMFQNQNNLSDKESSYFVLIDIVAVIHFPENPKLLKNVEEINLFRPAETKLFNNLQSTFTSRAL